MENNLGFSAVGWVHYRIAGGMRQILTISAIYAALLLGLIMFTVHMLGVRSERFYATASIMMLFLQTFVLLVFGVYRVAAAIRMDLTTNMIESHRLMPLRPSHAILGYIIGATTQTWALAAVNLAIGIGLGVRGGADVVGLLLAHGMLMYFALFVWTITAMCALIARAFIGAVTFAPVVFLMSQGTLLAVLPGLLLLMAPLLGETIFSVVGGHITQNHVLSLAGQTALGALFFFAAARRYRRPDTPAILPAMGLAILAVWVTLSLIGMSQRVSSAALLTALRVMPSPHSQLIVSMVAAMLLMVPIVCNAAWFAVYARRHRAEVAPEIRELVAVLALLLAVILGLVLTRGVRDTSSMLHFSSGDLARIGTMAMALAGFVTGLHYASRIAYRGKTPRGASMASLWLLLTWLAPLLVDLILNAVRQPNDYEISFASTLSPIGTTLVAFGGWLRVPGSPSPVVGAAVQLAIGMTMAALYYATEAKAAGWVQAAGPQVAEAGQKLRDHG